MPKRKTYTYRNKRYKPYKAARRLTYDGTIATTNLLRTTPRPSMSAMRFKGASINTGVMPRVARETIVYSTSFTMSAAGSAIDSTYYGANNIYDPQIIVGGHQPRGYDTLAQFYSHYKVLKSVAIWTFCPVKVQYYNDTGAGTSAVLGTAVNVNVGLDNDLSGPAVATTDPCSVNEVNGSKYAILSGNETAAKSLSMVYTPNSFFGPKSQAVQTGANFGNSPNNQAYFRISYSGVHPTAVPSDLHVQLTIKYYVECTQHIDQAVS